MTTKPVYGESGTSEIIFHQGGVLKKLSRTYGTAMAVTLEAVGNAIDENPERIWITADMRPRVRTIEIADDGKGASREEFQREALESIAASTKGKGQIGEHGLGFIGGLAICERYTFTAAPKRGDGVQKYFEWTFDAKSLESKKNGLHVPYRERTDIRHSRKLAGQSGTILYVPWRAAIKFMKISSDKIISRIAPDALEGQILARYGVPLRKRNIVVLLKFINAEGKETVREIRGKDFQGTPLQHVIVNPANSNEFAEFKLYLAPLTALGRRGRISFGERGKDYRISDKEFTMSVIELMDEDVRTALRSGVFEGEILSSCAKGNENRHSFDQDDALSTFCVAIIEWYRKYGEQHVIEAREARKEERYQKLGVRALDELTDLLKDEQYQHLIARSAPFVGSIGINHASAKHPLGETDRKAIATQGKKRDSDSTSNNGTGRKIASQEDPDHHPLTATGPSGKKRLRVKNSSLGLTLIHSEMPDSLDPYRFDPKTWELEVNICHPWFVKCDRTDAKLVKYQCTIVLHALTLNAHGLQENPQMVLNTLLELEVFQIAR